MSQYDDPKAAFEAEDNADEQQKTMTLSMLGGGSVEPDQPLGLNDDGEGRNVLGQTTLLIVLVAVIAAGSLYAMRLTQRDTEAPEDSSDLVAKLDTWITAASSGTIDPADPRSPQNIEKLFGDTADVLRVLNQDATEHQVPIRFVKQNPFTFALDDQAVTPAGDPYDPQRARSQRRRQLELQLSSYKVDSIMRGKRNVAIVNGEMYQVGDHLGDFVIEQIAEMQLTLRNGQERFTLSIKDTDTSRPRRR